MKNVSIQVTVHVAPPRETAISPRETTISPRETTISPREMTISPTAPVPLVRGPPVPRPAAASTTTRATPATGTSPRGIRNPVGPAQATGAQATANENTPKKDAYLAAKEAEMKKAEAEEERLKNEQLKSRLLKVQLYEAKLRCKISMHELFLKQRANQGHLTPREQQMLSSIDDF